MLQGSLPFTLIQFASIAEMRKYVEEPDTSASLKERIERLKKQHVDTVTKLVIYYGRRIEDDKLARYLETDDLKYLNDLPEYSEWKEHYARLEVSKDSLPIKSCVFITNTPTLDRTSMKGTIGYKRRNFMMYWARCNMSI